jgi:YegS/Rv2252/BmrU family lipid kinase
MIPSSACLIFNPVAGQGNSEQELALIQSLLQPKINLEICLTTPELGADQLARNAIKRGVEALIISGGDGTLSAATGPVIGTGIPLGIISRGTANAFATALDLPIAIESACETILEGKTRVVDAASCNGMPMVLLAGIGFEAETVELADRESKDRFGMLAYVLAGIRQLQNLEQFEAEIETEDKIITVTAAALTVANAAPPTSILAQGPAGLVADDGLLDLTIVSPANIAGAVTASYALIRSALQGEATQRDDIGYLRAQKFRIATNPAQKVVLDGEIVGTTPITVESIPGGLTIFSPQYEEVQPMEDLSGLPNLTVQYKDNSELTGT